MIVIAKTLGDRRAAFGEASAAAIKMAQQHGTESRKNNSGEVTVGPIILFYILAVLYNR